MVLFYESLTIMLLHLIIHLKMFPFCQEFYVKSLHNILRKFSHTNVFLYYCLYSNMIKNATVLN